VSIGQLIEDLGSYAYDPLGFVHWAFPWGEGELAGFGGPDKWQTDLLRRLKGRMAEPEQILRFAVASGHGVGKSALVSWIALWAFSTFPGTRGIITANTETQLKTRTWVELAKWHRLFIGKDLLQLNATTLYTQGKTVDKEWRIDIIPWSEKNPSAFQGMHNKGKRLVLIMDEAAEIHRLIWEAASGAMTDSGTEILWFAFGNPTDPNEMFRDCFEGGKFARRWDSVHVDGRDSAITNKALFEQWIEDYGSEDDDFVRVRVRGLFPKAAATSFISYESALAAVTREGVVGVGPVVLGVDVARFGDDFSVIYPRQGRDARIRAAGVNQGSETQERSKRVRAGHRRWDARVAMIDGTGVGGGVVDTCRAWGLNVVDVQFGAKPDGIERWDGDTRYGNKRTEIYGALRHFLRDGAICQHVKNYQVELPSELATLQYTFNAGDAIQLVPKAVTKKANGSPDVADALACTFAMPWVEEMPEAGTGQAVAKAEYDPFVLGEAA